MKGDKEYAEALKLVAKLEVLIAKSEALGIQIDQVEV